jgi:uncharacterized protein (TIRG00374 family)
MSRSTKSRIAQGVLALAGFGGFAWLLFRTDLGAIDRFSASSVAWLALLIAALAVVNYTFDTLSWWLICGRGRPSFLTLTSIRLRCEALTNILPGGAMIGEPMKIALLMQSSSMTRAEAATSFLLSKFAIIVGHIGYVVLGVALSYALVNQASTRVFNTPHVATIALVVALGLFLLLIGILAAMVWVRPMARWLLPSRRGGRWSGRWNTLVAELHRIEELIGAAARNGVGRLALALACGFVAWSFNAVEAYVVLRWIGADLPFSDVYAIDAVSSIVRMILFVLPIGIGGQDLVILGLMTAHGVAAPETVSAIVAIFKRGREFGVVAVGLALLALATRRDRAFICAAEESAVECDDAGDPTAPALEVTAKREAHA